MAGNPILTLVIVLFFMLTIGFSQFALYKIKERQFNRRNFAGLPMFGTYKDAVMTTWFEGMVCSMARFIIIISWIALLLTVIFFFFHPK